MEANEPEMKVVRPGDTIELPRIDKLLPVHTTLQVYVEYIENDVSREHNMFYYCIVGDNVTFYKAVMFINEEINRFLESGNRKKLKMSISRI